MDMCLLVAKGIINFPTAQAVVKLHVNNNNICQFNAFRVILMFIGLFKMEDCAC